LDDTGPRAFSRSTSQPQFPIAATHDREQHQQPFTLQQRDEYSQDKQVEEEDHVFDSSFASTRSERLKSPPTADNVSSPQCEHCSKNFSSRGELNKHMKTHTRPCQCTVNTCSARFATPKDLRRHMQSVHKYQVSTGNIMVYCPYPRCKFSANGGKGPMRRDTLQRHIDTKHQLGF
jgi:uncharacterized Zn-finger protein